MFKATDNFTSAVDDLGKFDQALHGDARLYSTIADILYEEVMGNFDAGGNPRWVPLAESTLMQRSRQGYSNPKPLEGLEHRLRKRSSATEAEVFMDGDPAIAGAHQFGTDRAGRGNTTRIPARPYLEIGANGRLKIQQAWSRHLVSMIR
jgi:phage virion morphogenesis protein